jgi:hypothetical protein
MEDTLPLRGGRTGPSLTSPGTAHLEPVPYKHVSGEQPMSTPQDRARSAELE